MAISDKTRKGLWGRSGNRCAICKTELVLEKDPYDKQLNVGEECHIISQQTNGPRHRLIDNFDYDSGDNLLLMCCNHHKEIDTRIESFPEEKLKEIKVSHEKWVKENLEGDTYDQIQEVAPKSELEILISMVSEKHDIEMNITSSREILHTTKGLEVASKEVHSIKIQIKETIGKIQLASPSYRIEIKDNEHRIVNIRFKGYTFLSQFYQAYSNSAHESYLLFAILKGSFMDNGFADPFDRPTLEQIIRLNFDYNEKGEFGWRNKEESSAFYKSKEITHEWIERFFKHVFA